MNSDEIPPALGWDAIDRVLKPLYADQQPMHYGTIVSYRLGGSDPLQGISAYRRSSPVPHWHFITYGLSELYEKESDNPQVSGWGIELTFRLSRSENESEPPAWALNFLQNLARYVFNTGNVFQQGHYMNLNGPICLQAETRIRAICFVQDAELPSITTPNGDLSFLQVVGITEAEEKAIKSWRGIGVMEAIQKELPLHVTDLHRPCLTENQNVMQLIQAGITKEGSNTDAIFTDLVSWQTTKPLLRRQRHEVTLGVLQVRDLLTLLPLRLGFGHTFSVLGKGQSLKFLPSDEAALAVENETLLISLPKTGWTELLGVLRAEKGEYCFASLGNLIIRVVPNVIRNAKGEAVETIG